MIASRQLLTRSVWTACLLALTCAQGLLAAPSGDDSHDGIAVVTSVWEHSQITDTAKQTRQLQLHETLRFNNQAVQTSPKAHLFLACSNGLGLGIDSNTLVYFESYQQATYSEERANLEYEPSTSELTLVLDHGALSISSEGLSPRSHVKVITPTGSLRVHSADCRIEQDAMGTRIIAYNGTVTFYYPDHPNREFVSKSKAVRISSQSAAIGKIAEKIDPSTLDAQKQRFTEAAHFASQRVFFKAPQKGEAPEPVLIVPSHHFEQEPARPYEFRK